MAEILALMAGTFTPWLRMSVGYASQEYVHTSENVIVMKNFPSIVRVIISQSMSEVKQIYYYLTLCVISKRFPDLGHVVHTIINV